MFIILLSFLCCYLTVDLGGPPELYDKTERKKTDLFRDKQFEVKLFAQVNNNDTNLYVRVNRGIQYLLSQAKSRGSAKDHSIAFFFLDSQGKLVAHSPWVSLITTSKNDDVNDELPEEYNFNQENIDWKTMYWQTNHALETVSRTLEERTTKVTILTQELQVLKQEHATLKHALQLVQEASAKIQAFQDMTYLLPKT